MSRFTDFISGKSPKTVEKVVEEPIEESVIETTIEEEVVVEEITEEPVRARDENGQFIADDPSTPENEAWVGGVAPKKRRKRSKK